MPRFSSSQKARLVAMAVAVEASYLLLAFVPAAALAILSAIVYGPERGALIGLALLVLVAWLIRPTPSDDRNDIPVAPGSALHQEVAAMGQRLATPAIHRIVLNDELNAAAHMSQGFLSALGVRRKLTIGVPLLRLLHADELKAVIAHELGHFSRQHGRVGQWVYRVQYKWGLYLLVRRSDTDSFLQSAQKLVAHRLIPYFLRQSSVWSHQCEYEADAHAESLGLSRHLISALTKLAIHDYLWREHVQQQILDWQLQGDTPPPDTLEQIARLVQSHAPGSLAPAMAYAQQKPRRVYDTHPALHERAQALRLEVRAPTDDLPCAGEVFFAQRWQSVHQQYQHRWTSSHAAAWRFAHYRLQWLATQARLPGSDDNTRAIAAAALSTAPESLEPLRTAVAAQPDNAYLQYELGRRLLEAEDATGLAHLQKAITLNKKMAMASLRLIHGYHADRDSVAQITRSLNRLDAASRWTDSFCQDDLWARFCTEPLEALPQAGRDLIANALAHDTRIDGCWVGSLHSPVLEGYQFKIHLVVFRLDGTDIHEPNKSEDHVREQVASLVQVVAKPDELIRVKSVFFSEPFNPNLLVNLGRHPGVCITPPQRPFNQNLIRIDSV